MQKAKLIAIIVICALFLILVLQNTTSVEAKILFFSIQMPVAAMLFGSLIVGFLIGLLVAGRILSARSTKATSPTTADRDG